MGNLITSKAITFFDVETTNLDPAKSTILSISIITDWEDGKQDVWTTKIKPLHLEMEYADPEALKVCKYNEAEWADAPTFDQVADTIIDKLKYGPIVAHNIQFDVSHIESVLKRYGYKKSERTDSRKKKFRLGYPQIDTCGLAYLFLPTERQNLNALREHFNLDDSQAHEAEADTRDCRHIFYSILNHVTPQG